MRRQNGSGNTLTIYYYCTPINNVHVYISYSIRDDVSLYIFQVYFRFIREVCLKNTSLVYVYISLFENKIFFKKHPFTSLLLQILFVRVLRSRRVCIAKSLE